MDRTKEEQPGGEEKKKDKESILTPLITTRATTNILAASTDDDTSTESSDTFDTWTLVSDKQKFMEPHAMAKDNDDSRIEIIKNSEPDEDEDIENAKKTAEQQHMEDSLKDVTTDDFSDGISIISETESVGRISPHPYVRDHLHDFSTTHNNMDDEILYRLRQETPIVLAKDPDEQQLRRRRRSSATADPTKEEKALQKSFQTVSLPLDMPPLVKRGLQGIFYIGVGLAILALIGKIINPTWQPLAGGKLQSTATSNQLEQKVNDMELQNNLMRAEIDLLNKQVKYLSSFKDPPQHKGKHKEGKTFKAWSGNGDSLKPVIITKEDLKRPYKCPDGSYVEFANMCMEQRPQNEPSLVDQFGQVVEDMKQQSETFKTFEKVAEELHGFQDNPFEQLDKILSKDKTEAAQPLPTKEFQSTEDAKQKYQHQHNPKAESKHHHKYDKSHEGKNFHDYSKESFEKFQEDSKKTLEKLRDNSKESFEKLRNNSREKFRKIRDDSKETFKKIRDNSKETFKKIRDNSKEQFEKFKDYTKNHGNFEERKAGKFDNSQESNEKSSKERFNRHKRQNDDKNVNNKDSGEWQEKYMQHREKQRKQNEHKYQNNENWYIKRGDSRETKRSGEKQYR